MATNDQPDVAIRVKIPCECCGSIAVMELDPERARATASALEAAAAGLERVEVVVVGRDS